MLKYQILTLIFLTTCFSCSKAQKKPNIIVIYTDDQRTNTLSSYDDNSPINTQNIDKLAEKMVCYSGEDVVELESQAAKISSMCAKWSNERCHYKRGMKSEQMLQEAIEEAYSEITRAKKMTLGLDDFLMALANAHEENIYLLKRSLKSSR